MKTINAAQSELMPALIEAYRKAIYRVEFGEPPVDLQVDQFSSGLSALMQQHEAHCCGLVTASNPRGQLRDEADNARRHHRLLRCVDALGYAHLTAWGLDPDERWPDEQGILIPGIPKPAACKLAAEFEQNALLWMSGEAIPRLILLR